MSILPLTATLSPSSDEDLALAIREAGGRRQAVYPIGGGTSLTYGLPAKQPGVGISTSNLTRVIDYPQRDMTITVESGITMAHVAAILATAGQQLPFDVPHADQATLGGVVATAWNGPRRYGYGAVRDFVIGIRAVDGSGLAFQGGGRVVKNVAGYDFCKLLTGSCGTLGIITQLTMKVRPTPQVRKVLVVPLAQLTHADAWLNLVAKSEITPVAMEWLCGPVWRNSLAAISTTADSFGLLMLEGTAPEVEWMLKQHRQECQAVNLNVEELLPFDSLWHDMVAWPSNTSSPLVLQAMLPPSGVVGFVSLLKEIDPHCDCVVHAGNGVVLVKLSQLPTAGLSRILVGKLQPAAAKLGGRVIILENATGTEATQQSYWGVSDAAGPLLQAVKAKFDPQGILNPERFVV